MSNLKEVVQASFTKGVVPTVQKFSQPKGILRNDSNLMFTERGALLVRDGDFIIASLNGSGATTGQGPIVDVAEYTPPNQLTQLLFLQNDITAHILTPNSLVAGSPVSGGAFVAGTYYWVVTATDGKGGETTTSNEVTASPTTNQKVPLTWAAVTNAVGYNVYRGTVPGNMENKLIASPATNAYTDTGTAGTPATVPLVNTTAQMILVQIPAGGNSYTKPGSVLSSFPADAIPIFPGPPGGSGGSGQGGGMSGGIATGGIQGATSVNSYIIQFAGSAIVLLGNGYNPIRYTAPNAEGNSSFILQPLQNHFVVSYPTWLAATAYLVGDQVIPPTPNGFAYTAQTSGTSGSSSPTFPTGLGSTVQDSGSGAPGVIWKNIGPTTVVAPRGAAFGLVHEGALFLWNTSPINTSDGLDGPCVLKQSDVQSFDNWNPINTAIIDKDDGEQGMGMASLTIAELGVAPTGAMVLFKEHKTYQVTSLFGASDFAIQRAKTEMGCIAPRSIFFVSGIGLIRLAHLGVAAFNGVDDQLISEEIRPFLFQTQTDITPIDWSYAYLSRGVGCATPPGYCLAVPIIGSAGALQRILFFDAVLRAWTIIDLPFAILGFHQVIAGGTIPLTITGGLSDGTIRRIQAGDDNSAVNWFFEPGTISEQGASHNTYVRRVLVRGNMTGSFTSATIVAESGGFPCNIRQVPLGLANNNSNAFQLDITINRKGTDFRLIVNGVGGAEIDSVVWHVVPGKVGQLASSY